MHEISIAHSIIEIAEATAQAQKSRSIYAIKIRLGEFTTVVREALEFAFEIARRGTLAQNARLEIESIPMRVQCVSCGPVAEPVKTVCLLCPQCGLPVKIVSGEELQVDSIDLESETENPKWSASRSKQTF